MGRHASRPALGQRARSYLDDIAKVVETAIPAVLLTIAIMAALAGAANELKQIGEHGAALETIVVGFGVLIACVIDWGIKARRAIG